MKILIVGLGGIGQRHLRNIQALLGEEAEIRAVDMRQTIPVLTDQLTVEAEATLEEKYNLHIYPELKPGLLWKPEVVFVCNPTSLHVPTALQAARAGCHLFIEKPLSHSLEQVQELIDLVESREQMAVVGYQMRFHPCLQRLFTLINEKRVGRILSVRAEVGDYLPGWHPYEDYRQLYASRRNLGGGVILTQIHEMDYLYRLFGLPGSIYALGGHLSRLEVDVEDSVDILMTFSVDGHSIPVSLHEDYVQRPPSRGCAVIGDTGKILVDYQSLTVTVFDGKGNQAEAASFKNFQRNQMFMDELADFFTFPFIHKEGGVRVTPLVNLEDAAQSLRMALAAKESLTTGKIKELVRELV